MFTVFRTWKIMRPRSCSARKHSQVTIINVAHQSCPPVLQSLAKELVGKCQGLPLAIVALGGLMSSKKSPLEWSKVYDSLNWHLTNNPLLESVKCILLLSFNDLSYQLTHCFLYCSLFPEDYLMGKNRLIKLWIA